MNALSLIGGRGRHGLQLAVAVIVSYLASAALGLPEGFWAVMSTLIVVRPDAGATIGAGWDRVRGTVLGTACGLAGVWLRHIGAGASEATLAIVAALAFASAGVPILRSAPITALIILSSGGIAGHSALQVAGLRVAEIAIGVTVGLAISVVVPTARATARFNAECAKVLKMISAHVDRSLAHAPRIAAEQEATAIEMRRELLRLAMLADSADLELRLFRRKDAAGAAPRHRRIAQLLTRVYQDASLLGRVFDALTTHRDDPLWIDLKQAACASLDSCAAALRVHTAPDLARLIRIDKALAQRRQSSSDADEKTDAPATLLAGPLRLLLDDLRAVSRIALASRAEEPSGISA